VKLDNRTDPRVVQFIEDVTSGSGKYCRLTVLAVERHLRDLEHAAASSYPYEFDFNKAQVALDFCKLVRHWKGEWAGQVFDPRPDEAFLLWCVFGWVRRESRLRRFRELLYEIAKKNGKTFVAAIVALLLLVLDREAGAEIYSTATMRDQAALAWQDAAKIVNASPALRSRIEVPKGRHSYTMYTQAGAKYKVLSAEDKGQDGVMPHGVINDELHRQDGRTLYDVLKYGSRSRRQPLFGHFTTAGDELDTTLYGEVHDYAIEILEGTVTGPAADEFFALIFTLDEGDDWKNPRAWVKANPGLGVNLRQDDLEKDFAEAVAKPAAEASFKRLRLNVRTTSSMPWIRAEDWDACFDPELVGWPDERFLAHPAFGGLDLGSTTDLTAFATLFPLDGDAVAIKLIGWCPEQHIAQRADRDRTPYLVWASQGWLKPTPGNVTDYRWIQRELETAATRYAYSEIGYDQARAADVVVRMADAGLPLVAVPQGPVQMTAPITRLEDLVLARRVRHDGNPLLKQCVLNARCVEVASGSTTLKKLRKANYRARIDGATATLNALALYLQSPPGAGMANYQAGDLFIVEAP